LYYRYYLNIDQIPSPISAAAATHDAIDPIFNPLAADPKLPINSFFDLTETMKGSLLSVGFAISKYPSRSFA